MVKVLVTFQPGFESLAERDVRQADPRAKMIEALEPGLWLARGPLDDAPDEPSSFVKNLAGAIAIRHLHPVSLDALVADLPELVAAVAPLGQAPAQALDPTRSYAVQTRIVGPAMGPKAIEINDAIAAALAPLGVPYDRKAPDQVVSVAPAGLRELAGVGPTRDNLSAWPGGARRFARVEGSPSRAEHKLLEALEVFAFEPKGRALDLGAAPGGWTKVLAERGMNVVAIDPADIDAAVAALPGVRTYRGTAERYLSARGAPVDLVVSDMRMDARDAARLLLDFRPLVAAGGHVLTTLKLPERGYLGTLDAALEILGEGYRRVGARQLFHNRNEVTLLLEPKR